MNGTLTWKAVLSGFASVAFVGLTGCKSQTSTVCELIGDCVGYSDEELEDCKIQAEADYDKASNHNCDQKADELLDCMEEEGDCNDDQFDIGDCEKEQESLKNCLD